MLMSLLEWVCEASLSQSADTDESPIHVQAWCLKVDIFYFCFITAEYVKCGS